MSTSGDAALFYPGVDLNAVFPSQTWARTRSIPMNTNLLDFTLGASASGSLGEQSSDWLYIQGNHEPFSYINPQAVLPESTSTAGLMALAVVAPLLAARCPQFMTNRVTGSPSR